MGRAAADGARTGDTSPDAVLKYIEHEAGDLTAKIGSTAGMLQTMAGAAVQGAAVQAATIAVASAPTMPLPVVVVDPSALPGAVS
jgi:hypothetical protein